MITFHLNIHFKLYALYIYSISLGAQVEECLHILVPQTELKIP